MNAALLGIGPRFVEREAGLGRQLFESRDRVLVGVLRQQTFVGAKAEAPPVEGDDLVDGTDEKDLDPPQRLGKQKPPYPGLFRARRLGDSKGQAKRVPLSHRIQNGNPRPWGKLSRRVVNHKF